MTPYVLIRLTHSLNASPLTHHVSGHDFLHIHWGMTYSRSASLLDDVCLASMPIPRPRWQHQTTLPLWRWRWWCNGIKSASEQEAKTRSRRSSRNYYFHCHFSGYRVHGDWIHCIQTVSCFIICLCFYPFLSCDILVSSSFFSLLGSRESGQSAHSTPTWTKLYL
jgi:hypothetical protein